MWALGKFRGVGQDFTKSGLAPTSAAV